MGDVTLGVIPSTGVWGTTATADPTYDATTHGQDSPPYATLNGLSVKTYGAVGDGVTDDTTAIQACFDAAAAAYRPVFFPPCAAGQFYKLTAAITISRRAQIITGTNKDYCVVKQMTAAAHAFVLAADATAGPWITTGTQDILFEKVSIYGQGIGTATGYGIYSNIETDHFTMRDAFVDGFAIGAYLNGASQVLFENTELDYCGIGCQTAKALSSSNTVSWVNSGCSRSNTIGWLHEGGGGCTVAGGDWVEQPLAMQLGTGVGSPAVVSINGGNFEAVTGAGTEFIQVKSGTRLSIRGSQFQKVDGVDADAININGGSVDADGSNTLTGMAAGKVLIRKTASTDIVRLPASTTNLSTSPDVVADPGTSYPFAQFIQVADNAVPSAAAIVRGLLLQVMGRDSATARDELVYYLRNRKSAGNVYDRYSLSRIMYGTGSPEGVVTASIGTLYVNDSGGSGTTLYAKESLNGNTGWIAYGPVAGPTGATGPAGPAGSTKDLQLAALGLISENYSYDLQSTQATPTSGTIYGAAIGLFSGQVVTNLCVGISTPGAGTAPTLIRLGLADHTGTIVAVTADVHASSQFTASRLAQLPINGGAYTTLDGLGHTIVFIQVGSWGSTNLQLGRCATLVANGMSTALTGKLARLATFGTGLSDLPAVSSSLAAAGGNTTPFWFAAA